MQNQPATEEEPDDAAQRQADGDAAHGGRALEGAPDRGEEDGEKHRQHTGTDQRTDRGGKQGDDVAEN